METWKAGTAATMWLPDYSTGSCLPELWSYGCLLPHGSPAPRADMRPKDTAHTFCASTASTPSLLKKVPALLKALYFPLRAEITTIKTVL